MLKPFVTHNDASGVTSEITVNLYYCGLWPKLRSAAIFFSKISFCLWLCRVERLRNHLKLNMDSSRVVRNITLKVVKENPTLYYTYLHRDILIHSQSLQIIPGSKTHKVYQFIRALNKNNAPAHSKCFPSDYS